MRLPPYKRPVYPASRLSSVSRSKIPYHFSIWNRNSKTYKLLTQKDNKMRSLPDRWNSAATRAKNSSVGPRPVPSSSRNSTSRMDFLHINITIVTFYTWLQCCGSGSEPCRRIRPNRLNRYFFEKLPFKKLYGIQKIVNKTKQSDF